VIVRIMGEGQWKVDDETAEGLNQLDEQVSQAVEAGDEENLMRLLGMMADAVHEKGEPLPEGDLHPSDAIVPPRDLTLDEARQLLEGEGLIPDLPTR
jgi:PspA-Associated protein